MILTRHIKANGYRIPDPKGNSQSEIFLLKLFGLKQKLSQILPPHQKKQPYVPSDCNFMFRVNVETSSKALK